MKALLLGFVWLASLSALAQSEYDRHVAFDNSLASGSFYYSHGSVVAPSQLELVKGRVPVDDTHFLTPPNALRLQWQSQPGGDWAVTLDLNTRYGAAGFSGSALYFWCYSDLGLSSDESPRIFLRDSHGEGTNSISLIGPEQKIPPQTWFRIRLPFVSFVGMVNDTRDVHFDPSHLTSLTLVQGLDDRKPHTLYIDEITIGDEPMATNLAAPTGLNAKGYDRHVDISWN